MNSSSNSKTKLCCSCYTQPVERNKYFCSIACYTRFRIGLVDGVDVDNVTNTNPSKISYEYPKKPRRPPGFIDYTKFNYCRSCMLKVSKSELRCWKCSRRVHTCKKNKLRNQTEDKRIRVST